MDHINQIFLKGNVAFEPNFREVTTKAGKPFSVCTVKIAVETKLKDREEKCFVDITALGKDAMMCRDSIRVGMPIIVKGRLKEERWQDKKDQSWRSKHVVVAESIQIDQEIQRGENVGQMPMLEQSQEQQVAQMRTSTGRVPPSATPARKAAPYQAPRNEASPNLYEDSDLPF